MSLKNNKNAFWKKKMTKHGFSLPEKIFVRGAK